MAAGTCVILGVPNARLRLARLAAIGGGAACTRALQAGALIIQTGAKRRAPVLTGNLRRSLHTETIDATHVAVGTDVEYAPHQEYGAPRANVPPHPFLRPAIDEDGGAAIKAIETVLTLELRAVAL